MISKFQFVEVNTLKLFLSQWNQYNHAETFLRGIVSAWLSICDYSGLPQPEKRCLFIRNETNSKNRKREKPCRTSIFAKRKRLIVSDTLVSKLSTLFGAGDLGSNTPRALGRLCSQRPYRFAMRLLPPITDKKRNGPSPFLFLVPVTGVEPVRCCHLGILSPVRLPIPPHRLTT